MGDFKSAQIKDFTWERLTIIKAWTGEKMWQIIDRLVKQEYERLKKEKEDRLNIKKPLLGANRPKPHQTGVTATEKLTKGAFHDRKFSTTNAS